MSFSDKMQKRINELNEPQGQKFTSIRLHETNKKIVCYEDICGGKAYKGEFECKSESDAESVIEDLKNDRYNSIEKWSYAEGTDYNSRVIGVCGLTQEEYEECEIDEKYSYSSIPKLVVQDKEKCNE